MLIFGDFDRIIGFLQVLESTLPEPLACRGTVKIFVDLAEKDQAAQRMP